MNLINNLRYNHYILIFKSYVHIYLYIYISYLVCFQNRFSRNEILKIYKLENKFFITYHKKIIYTFLSFYKRGKTCQIWE